MTYLAGRKRCRYAERVSVESPRGRTNGTTPLEELNV